MSLITNLFSPNRAATPDPTRNSTPASTTSDSDYSFDDALQAARDSQQSTPSADSTPASAPAAAPPAATPDDGNLRRADKKDTHASDSSDSAADGSHTTADEANQSPQPSATTSTPATTETKAGKKSKPDVKATNDAASQTQPSDISAAQLLVATLPPQPLPTKIIAPTATPAATVATEKTTTAALPAVFPTAGHQQNPAAPSKTLPKSIPAPAPTAQTTQTPATPDTLATAKPQKSTPAKNDTSPKSDLNKAVKSLSPQTSAALANADAKTDSNADTAQEDPTADDSSTPATPALKQNSKDAIQSSHAAVITPSTDAGTPSPTALAQTLATDGTAAADVVKSLAAQPSDETPRTDMTTIPSLASATTPATVDHRAEAAAPAQNSPAVDADQTFEQVVLGLRAKVDATHTKAEISLNPPNLGTLHVSVSLENGTLTAQFQSSSDVVRDLLKGNMDKLKSVLESQGVSVDKLAVGAPQDKTEIPNAAPSIAQNNQSANDGRSAGQYQEQSSGQKRSKDPNAFARAWRDATEKTPIDLVA